MINFIRHIKSFFITPIIDKEYIFVYVANPFSSKDKKVEKNRYLEILKIIAKILDTFEHIVPFSPIAYTYYIEQECEKIIDWYTIDLEYLYKADVVLVVKQDGWRESYGVQLEIEEAHKNKIPVIYADPDKVIETLGRALLKNALGV